MSQTSISFNLKQILWNQVKVQSHPCTERSQQKKKLKATFAMQEPAFMRNNTKRQIGTALFLRGYFPAAREQEAVIFENSLAT